MKCIICVFCAIVMLMTAACSTDNVDNKENDITDDAASDVPIDDEGEKAYYLEKELNKTCLEMDNFGGAYYVYQKDEDRFVCIVRLKDPTSEEDKEQVLAAAGDSAYMVEFEDCVYSLSYLHELRRQAGMIILEYDDRIRMSNFITNMPNVLKITLYEKYGVELPDRLAALDTEGGGDAIWITTDKYEYERENYHNGYENTLEAAINTYAETADIEGDFLAVAWPDGVYVKVFYEADKNPGLRDKLIALDTQGNGSAIVFEEYTENTFSERGVYYLISLYKEIDELMFWNKSTEGKYYYAVCPETSSVKVFYQSAKDPDLPEKIKALDTAFGGDALVFEEYDKDAIAKYTDGYCEQ